MDNLTSQKVININSVFDNHYIDSKDLYLYYFGKIPCIDFVNHINGEKAFEALQTGYGSLIVSVHSHRRIEGKQKKIDFDDTIVVLNNQCVLEFDAGYCEILSDYSNRAFVQELIGCFTAFHEKQRRKPFEMNLIVRSGN